MLPALWLLHFTVFVLRTGVGAAPQQLQGAQPLASIGGTVQRSVAQQICAVDIWRLLPAELQQNTQDRNKLCHLSHTDSELPCVFLLLFSLQTLWHKLQWQIYAFKKLSP